MPPISPLADRCIECGFCEPRCPSRELTTTPRQRIVITREMARLGAASHPDAAATLAALAGDFVYQGLATCARDSMCMTSCPVRIDTGALMKELQAAAHSPRAQRTALAAARHFRLAASAARGGLRIASWLRRLPGGAALLERASGVLHRRAPALAPRVDRQLALPRPAPPLRRPAAAVDGAPGVVYFPSCLSRIIGPLPGETQGATARAMLEVLERAGFAVVHPPGLDGLCCGMPFSSKAFRAAADECAARSAEALWEASDGGSRPVVTDASPCAGTLRDLAGARLAETGRTLALLDFPTFWAAHGLPRGLPVRKQRRVVLHPTCTLMKMGGMADLLACARAHADEVLVPAYAECCGFGGDRGFQVPELTASAAAHEAEEVRALTAGSAAGLYSTCRTCEIGMTRAVGQSYGSLVHLVRDTLAAAPPR